MQCIKLCDWKFIPDLEPKKDKLGRRELCPVYFIRAATLESIFIELVILGELIRAARTIEYSFRDVHIIK